MIRTNRLNFKTGWTARSGVSGILIVLLCILLASPCPAGADEYEDYQAALKAVDGYSGEINEAIGAVGGALYQAMAGKVDEPQPWRDLAEKMNRLTQILPNNISAMDTQVPRIFNLNPTAWTPSIRLENPFDRALQQMDEREKMIQRELGELNKRIANLDVEIAKFRSAIQRATATAYNDTLNGMLPGMPELLGEAGVAGFGAIGAIVTLNPLFLGAAVTAGAAVLAFNAAVNIFYTADSLAKQVAAFQDMINIMVKHKAYLEELKRSLDPARDEVKLIKTELGGYKKKFDEMREKVIPTIAGWTAKAGEANKRNQDKLREQAQKLLTQPQPTINLGTYAYGMSPIPPLTPGDYASEAQSMIGQMDSACKAVEDGGEPHVYREISWPLFARLSEQYKTLSDDYQAKYKAYGKASEVTSNAIGRAYEQARRASDSLWASYVAGGMSSEALNRALSSTWNAYNAAQQAAYAQLQPFGQAMIQPYWNMAKVYRIFSLAAEADSLFMQRISAAISFRTSEFWRVFREFEQRFGETSSSTLAKIEQVPGDWTVTSWKKKVESLDDYVQKSLNEGANPIALRSELLSSAATLRDIDDIVKKAGTEYDKENLQRTLLSNNATRELESLLTRYGKLVSHQGIHYPYLPWAGEPMKPQWESKAKITEENVKYFSELIKQNFTVYEPEHLKLARATNWSGWSGRYEQKAGELNVYADWIDRYRGRLEVAQFRIDGISMEQTGRSLYAPRTADPAGTLKKEFAEPQWAAITQGIQKYVTAEQFGKLPWARIQPWDSLTPWQKLYAAETLLLYRMNEEMKYYVQVKAQGGFMPVQESIFRPIKEAWDGIRPLCEQYDALAAPLGAKIGDAPEKIGQEVLAVNEIYGKMPAASRIDVQETHRRFQNMTSWVMSYLTQKKDALKTLTQPPTNSVTLQLDDLILGYGPALEKWKQQQEEANRQMEASRKRQEEDFRIRQEAERKKAEEEQRKTESNLALVKDLYAGFKNAYEAKNDSQVMSFISDQWQAGDGATLSDLQTNLRRTFRVFDEVRYNIQNLSITLNQPGQYLISYDVTITSRIYKRNLKHEEKSSINEEVLIDGSGKARISRTMSGRFWYVQ